MTGRFGTFLGVFPLVVLAFMAVAAGICGFNVARGIQARSGRSDSMAGWVGRVSAMLNAEDAVSMKYRLIPDGACWLGPEGHRGAVCVGNCTGPVSVVFFTEDAFVSRVVNVVCSIRGVCCRLCLVL